MHIRQEAIRTLADYLFMFPDEFEPLMALAQQLTEDQQDVTSRANMRGHVTTSAVVLDTRRQLVLLVHHNIYDRWLQPGGHFEASPGGSGSGLWDSALREVQEETGISSVALHPWSGGAYVPFDVDTHAIAENPKKGEGAHWHHDFVFLAEADSTLPLNAQLNEVAQAQWVPISKLQDLDGRLQRVYRKLVSFQIASA